MTSGRSHPRPGSASTPSGYYERRGVLPPAPRTASGYRVYTEAAVARSGSPAACRASGLTLDEIIGALQAQRRAVPGASGRRPANPTLVGLREALDRIEAGSRTWSGACRVREALTPAEAGSCELLLARWTAMTRGTARRALAATGTARYSVAVTPASACCSPRPPTTAPPGVTVCRPGAIAEAARLHVRGPGPDPGRVSGRSWHRSRPGRSG